MPKSVNYARNRKNRARAVAVSAQEQLLRRTGLIVLILAALMFGLVRMAGATVQGPDHVQPLYSECLVFPSGDLTAVSDIVGCPYRLTLPSSMAFRCSLYVDEGYPSDLLRKVCILYDKGIIQDFLQGAAGLPKNLE